MLRALDASAATESDVTWLMAAVPALVRAIRYGDVRGTATGALSAVVDALTVRVCAGLPAAAGGLADDAAAALRASLDGMHAALGLHAQGELGGPARGRWMAALAGLDGRRDVHGLVAGRVVRLLADGEVLSPDEAAARFAAALSVGVQAADKAPWAEGFLSGSGLLLAHDRDLLGILDGWLASLSAQEFLDVLPLLRRTFGGFAEPERSSIGRAARQLIRRRSPARRAPRRRPAAANPSATRDEVDADRAAGVLRTVAMILGGNSGRGSMSAQDPAAARVPADPGPGWRPSGRAASVCGAGGCCSARPPTRAASGLSAADRPSMRRLAALYNDGPGSGVGGRRGGRGGSSGQSGAPPGWARRAPKVARWLGDIRTYFPSTVVQVMQRDAIDRLNLRQLLLEPEMLERSSRTCTWSARCSASATLMPETTKATARARSSRRWSRRSSGGSRTGPGPPCPAR